MKIRIKDLIFSFEIYRTDAIIGVGSKCSDGKHCLFLDLDNHTEDKARKVIKKVIDKYSLSHGLLIKSSFNNYHAVFFDKLPFMKTVNIQASVNIKHAGVSLIKQDSTIRISSKFKNSVEFIGLIISPFTINELSNGHYIVFRDLFKWDDLFKDNFKVDKFDNLDSVKCYAYEKRFKL